MIHSFDTDIAKECGVTAAIILNNLYFWIEKNRANGDNTHDGMVWTYNSQKAFSELFPYLTERQIRYTLDKLRDDGYIVTGNYNKNPYDKTLWYAITEKGYSILQKSQLDVTKLSNRSDDIGEPIPDSKQDIKTTDSKPDIKDNAVARQSDDIAYKENKIQPDSIKKKREKQESRHKYGEYKNVLLTDEDLVKLKAEFPADWQDRIERLGSYIESTGKKYKNHLATIRNWARRDAEKNRPAKTRYCTSETDYSGGFDDYGE